LFETVFLKLLNVKLTYASVLFFEMFDMVSFTLWYLSGIMGIFQKKTLGQVFMVGKALGHRLCYNEACARLNQASTSHVSDCAKTCCLGLYSMH
jgi:hypothetical protein